MNFRDFMKQRAELLAANPGTLDLTETNLPASLEFIRVAPTEAELPAKAHRCHLAEFWLDAFKLSRDLKPRTLVSEGVRQSLGLLFGGFAQHQRRALIPADVYPVYLDLARAGGLQFETYSAECELTAEVLGNADVLLLTHPAKPFMKTLGTREKSAIAEWLSGDAARRLIIDGVYLWDDRLPDVYVKNSNQAYFLHSLSKGWLRPLILGVALVPDQDVEMWTPVFRALTPSQDNLRLAQTLLTAHADFPAAVPLVLADAETRMREALTSRGISLRPTLGLSGRYHFIVDGNWKSLLEKHNVLALPLGTFGSNDEDRSVVTSLRFARV
jgi:histidinol-phosphate/aromatic aminotransferase/cobyric acid decarboxylase-like protein